MADIRTALHLRWGEGCHLLDCAFCRWSERVGQVAPGSDALPVAGLNGIKNRGIVWTTLFAVGVR